jgi:hypothetical protein
VGGGSNLNDLWKFDGVNWTWVNGPNSGAVFFETGIYGTKGTASPSNRPPARADAVSWIDRSGALWLFGGTGFDSTVTYGLLNDLWKFDGTNWTWVSGADTVLQAGTYGTQGTASPANVPGARLDSISWTDKNGTFWLFGGTGIDPRGADVLFNDLWKFDGSNWTWVSGSSTTNQAGVYGTKGQASSSTVPGARAYSSPWIDGSGNLWLFGGFGTDSGGLAFDDLNDLWRFTP